MRVNVDRVIQRYGYFGHPKNILLVMLADEREQVRASTLQSIVKARESVTTSPRVFVLPKLNLEAENYTEN